MKKGLIISTILAMTLVLGLTVIACDEDDDNEGLPMGPKWTTVSNPPLGGKYFDIAFGDGKFIVVGHGGHDSAMAYSTDGVNWTKINNYISSIYRIPEAIAYGNGRWVTGDDYLTSTDGINWNVATKTPSISNISKIAYGNGKFVAIGGQNKIAYTTDGLSWEMVSNPPSVYLQDIAYGGGKFIAVGRKINGDDTYGNAVVASSEDGISWTTVSPSLFGDSLDCIAYGGGKFVASGGATAYSSDGISWKQIIGKEEGSGYSGVHYSGFKCIAYGNGKWMAIVDSSCIAYSSDGINWTPAFNPPDIFGFLRATYGNGKFIVVTGEGGGGGMAYSTQ
ncbi:MAG: hypothetical protein LBH44_09505 [Treponema sp.]|nr:hypothetical protein [Treponema sp.]